MTTLKLGAAAQIIARLLDRPGMDVAELARELVMAEPDLRSYVSGDARVPLDRQLCLAAYLIERVPEYARRGYMLRGQARAAIAVERGSISNVPMAR